MRIAISGHSGCGNTTASLNVCRELGLKGINYTFRDLAVTLEMEFDELHADAPCNAIYDYLTDLMLIRASLANSVIVGSRLAAWIIEADLRIWLHAPLEIRAGRIWEREKINGRTYEETLYRTLKRDDQNVRRYLRLYGIHLEDQSDFDIIINTHQLSAEQVSSLITSAARWAKANPLVRRNLHAKRIQAIIGEKLRIPENILTDVNTTIDVKEIFHSVRRA